MCQIYLDFNASTPICPEAVEAMRPFLFTHYGNPSSLHWAGMSAKDAVEKARGQVAALLGCDPTEVVFTSGGSESNNHAIKGVFFANRNRGDHIITTAVEHPATLNPCRFLETLGAKVTVLPVDRFGMVDPNDVRKAITPRTILVTVMHANNEVGTIEPVAEIAAIAREAGLPFHTDAAQTVGKISADVDELGVGLLSVSDFGVRGVLPLLLLGAGIPGAGSRGAPPEAVHGRSVVEQGLTDFDWKRPRVPRWATGSALPRSPPTMRYRPETRGELPGAWGGCRRSSTRRY